ncbi:hypothetical protein WAI453_003734 [Rhynchosporium graminicola]
MDKYHPGYFGEDYRSLKTTSNKEIPLNIPSALFFNYHFVYHRMTMPLFSSIYTNTIEHSGSKIETAMMDAYVIASSAIT